jgi:hypothetical protein
MFKENLNAPIGTFGALKIIKNEVKMRKLWPPKVEGVKNSKKTNHQIRKANSQTTKKFLVCWYVVIKNQR